MKRKIIEIDQDRCNGCRKCVSACHEGAIQMVNGKAKLVSDVYCDGLGACIGDCPVDAIKIIEREAGEFSEEAVKDKKAKGEAKKTLSPACGCPGMAMKTFPKPNFEKKQTSYVTVGDVTSELTQWPVQLKLVPVNAPYWKNASLLVAADCSAFSMGAFHNKMLKDKKLVIACPKLDDTGNYLDKLSAIIKENSLKNITVIYMEVPCCKVLVAITEDALARSGKNIPLKLVKLSLDGNII
jgi:NAD-dependent dihydropyrimidine dehydrogenase PreA subunit